MLDCNQTNYGSNNTEIPQKEVSVSLILKQIYICDASGDLEQLPDPYAKVFWWTGEHM